MNPQQPFFPPPTGQRRAFAANTAAGFNEHRHTAMVIAAGLALCALWLLTMQTELTSRVTGKRASATEQARDTTVTKTRPKSGPHKTPSKTITVPLNEWNALLKRMSDIEAWRDRNTHVAAVGLPRVDWETAEAESMVDATMAAPMLSLSSPNQVRQRVRDHKLFGVIAPGRERGMLFPVWQFDRSVIGEPLQQVLTALHAQDLQGWAIHEFFEEPRVTLEGLSARQVLTGTVDSGGYAPSAHRLLAAAPQERLARVLTAIEEYSNES